MATLYHTNSPGPWEAQPLEPCRSPSPSPHPPPPEARPGGRLRHGDAAAAAHREGHAGGDRSPGPEEKEDATWHQGVNGPKGLN